MTCIFSFIVFTSEESFLLCNLHSKFIHTQSRTQTLYIFHRALNDHTTAEKGKIRQT